MAEIELSALSRQCLDCRIADMVNLSDEVSSWERERNAIRATVRRRSIKIMPEQNSRSITLICKINVTEH